MKQLLILMLVLGLAPTAGAVVTMELREADGVTPVEDLFRIWIGSDYVLVISGASADAGASLGLYGPTYTAADWDYLGPGGQSAATTVDTGDLSYINWVSPYYGYDMIADDSGSGPGVSTGDWFTIDLTCLGAFVDFSFDLLDYKNNSTVIASVDGVIIPEPMTIALLGVGALLLRRRK